MPKLFGHLTNTSPLRRVSKQQKKVSIGGSMPILEKVYFIVEVEHENDKHECTSYSRETLRRKIYTSRKAAEQARKRLQSALPMNHRGFRQGKCGEIYHWVVEATIGRDQRTVILDKGTHHEPINSCFDYDR